MFNVKLREEEDEEETQRQGNEKIQIVVLYKNYVEIEGRTKIIVLIRDETDKVKLE
jgi:hypothetical protein